MTAPKNLRKPLRIVAEEQYWKYMLHHPVTLIARPKHIWLPVSAMHVRIYYVHYKTEHLADIIASVNLRSTYLSTFLTGIPNGPLIIDNSNSDQKTVNINNKRLINESHVTQTALPNTIILACMHVHV